MDDYTPGVVDRFRGPWAFLSNFWISSVEYDGVSYPTVEHAFQAAKTTCKVDRNRIRAAITPGKAKALGRKVSLRSDWEEVKIGVMYELLRQKFSNPELRQRLLDTGEATLIEGNWWGDVFWGVCNGSGENHLGKLLMKIRKEICNDI